MDFHFSFKKKKSLSVFYFIFLGVVEHFICDYHASRFLTNQSGVVEFVADIFADFLVKGIEMTLGGGSRTGWRRKVEGKRWSSNKYSSLFFKTSSF